VDGLRDMLESDFQFNEVNSMILIELGLLYLTNFFEKVYLKSLLFKVSTSNFWLLSLEIKDHFTSYFKYLVFETVIYGLQQ
jgi:hypothetical protein